MEVRLFVNPAPPVISELLRGASQADYDAEFDRAIGLLRAAYVEIAKTGFDYTVKTFLRLPAYLQHAGKGREAWQEFDRLLAVGYPGMRQDPVMLPMTRSEIYQSMRLFLQRERRPVLAVGFEILAYVRRADSFRRQKRRREVGYMRAKSAIAEALRHHLKRAQRPDALSALTDYVRERLRFQPDLPDDFMLQQIRAMLGMTETYP
jgi:hypothetical protein